MLEKLNDCVAKTNSSVILTLWPIIPQLCVDYSIVTPIIISLY